MTERERAVQISNICNAMLYTIRAMETAAQQSLLRENKINFERELRYLHVDLEKIEKLLEAG